jgi:hypothetical protein
MCEDQSNRPISNLEAEMSEATNMRVVSFAQDIIYDVTSCKVLNPERVGLDVLLSNLTVSVELEKFLTTRILVASDISASKFEIGRSDWSSLRTKLIKLYNKFGIVTHICHGVRELMRYDSFCFDYQTTPSALATTYKKNPKY